MPPPGLFLDSVRRRPSAEEVEAFPWTLPLFARFEALAFDAPVTFFVGENGSGKSTLLEGLAAGMGAVPIGGRDLRRDPTLAAARALAAGLVFVRRRAPRSRSLFRAEDAMGFVNRVVQERAELETIARELEESVPGEYGRRRATGLARGQAGALASRYGADPHARSHGETFLDLLETRMVPGGLHFLDEPEAALSPSRTLALMRLIARGVSAGSQFVVATHSPILTALPGGRLLHLDGDAIREIAWAEFENVAVTRAFLADPARVLSELELDSPPLFARQRE